MRGNAMTNNGLYLIENKKQLHRTQVRLTVPVRTLVVDDMPEMLGLTCALLDRNPFVHVVGTASNGAEAVERARQLCPDLVVMDISMPIMNGLEAALHLRDRNPDIRILMVTASDEPDIEEASYECGANGFTRKSDLTRELDSQIATIFSWPRA
jgi:two-component system, NarL family, nitrate/nitrite response regulator NarL